MYSGKLISFLKAMTIGLPLLIGIIRFKKIDKTYLPFIIYLAAGTCIEMLTFLQINNFSSSNAIPSNIFCLAEWLLIVWQFYAWGFFKKEVKALGLLVLFVTLIWFTENIFYHKLTVFSPYYREIYYFFIVLMSVNIINYTIINDYKNILRNARFLICLGFIFFFVYRMVYEWAYQIISIITYEKVSDGIINVKSYETVSNQIISWFGYVNASVNIIFAVAMLLIPSKNYFTLNRKRINN